jgi:hypothetical protein
MDVLIEGKGCMMFSDEEWAWMMGDPVRFGYSCERGHRVTDHAFFVREGCMACMGIAEAAAEMDGATADEWAVFDRWVEGTRAFPLLDCGRCGGTHVGEGAVASCRGA